MKNKIKIFIELLVAITICAFSFNLFLLPTKVISGFSGISIIINSITDIKPSIIIMVLYVIILVISYILMGFEQTKNSIIGSILYPIFVELTSYITPYINIGETEPIVMAICGSAICGFGYGIIYKLGYNTGGSDVLTHILSKYLKKPIGTCMVIVNTIIIAATLFVFDLQTAIYSIIAILIMSYVIDKVMIGISKSKSFYIITENETDVKKFLISKLSHGVTVIQARGGYTGNMVKLIMCIVPTKEYFKVKEEILNIDKNALILVSDTYEVLGNK